MPDQPYTTRECVQRDGTRTLVVTGDLDAARAALEASATSSAAPEGAALSASGTVRRAGGPDHGTAPVGDDVKARAREAAYDAGLRPYASYVHAVVGALAAAGLLRAAPTDAAIEHVAARLWVECGETMYHGAWERVDGYLRRKYLGIARAVLAAAEEARDA